MLSLLSTYAVPLIGTVILGLFAKPTNDKTVLQNILNVLKPSTTSPTTNPLPTDLLKLLPSLLDQLLRKPPPVSPDEPLPAPVTEPKSPQDLITYILSLLSLPTSPIAPGPDLDELIDPVEHHSDIASLVACANAVAVAHPDFDISVVVNENGVQVGKVKRAKP
jgi:hypothetical protein